VKVLYLLRHAKSSWKDASLDDHDRPLAKRGRRAADAMAGYLESNGIRPALVLCSSALRATQTLDGVFRGSPRPEVEVEPGLYGASEDEIMNRIQLVPDSVPSVLVIGHNPGLHDLALSLAGSGVGIPRLREKFPTAALVALRFASSRWSGIGAGDADLIDFVRPKDLSPS
jgi:phosphohistidine phosphatase